MDAEKPRPSLAAIAAKAALGTVPYGGGLVEVIDGLQARRNHSAEHALGAISERVGWDALLSIVERDPEREALLWAALQAITNTGLESKRRVLREVAANALESSELIDMEQLQVMALSALDGPHIRALARLAHAEDRDTAEGATNSRPNNLSTAASAEPVPVMAALLHTGVAYPSGPYSTEPGTASFDDPRSMAISGVTPFGRELLAALESAP